MAAEHEDADVRFARLMIVHHDGAVETARTELADGANPQALALARSMIDDQTAEIAEMAGTVEDLWTASTRE